ncbi:MAG: single-stranded DNA-binding protein [Candidatus Kerfeldbacteria bacterium]|nr:single-stranded DNA-binding protein [Candidatus Kerfeldbacteria bacterium]
MDFNRVTLVGNLVRDPEAKKTGKGGGLTTFTLATNRVWRDPQSKEKNETVEFHPVAAWGKLGEVVAQYVKKGNKVYLEGRIAHQTFTNKTGAKQSAVNIIAENLILLSPQSPDAEE